MAVSDVIQDGGQGNIKLHPYLITLVRWCVSCAWSTATVFLHRLLAAPTGVPQITAPRQPPRPALQPRRAGTEHLHPEPRVQCVVLHAPAAPTLDVIFVHGLYGSLGNTWRQGEWRAKYKLDPTRVSLRNHPTETCSCAQDTPEHIYDNLRPVYTDDNSNENNLNEKVTFNQLNGCFKKILPNETSLITEKFYNNTLLQNVNNYETQAEFVTELFKNDCDNNCDLNTFKCKFDQNGLKCNCEDRSVLKCHSENCKCKLNELCKLNECKCKLNVKSSDAKCEVGCGCVCDECYSPCWPRDWIKEDFPGARVISINYTSDPYLWRPLWVKGNKRLRLHERADQMMDQLIQLGVGQRPIVWVGHSKGGLFIKQMYCEAYDAYLKLDKNEDKLQTNISNNREDQSNRKYNKTNIEHKYDTSKQNTSCRTNNNNENCNHLLNNFMNEHHNNVNCTKNGETALRNIDEMNKIRNNNNSGNNFNLIGSKDNMNKENIDNNYNIIDDSNEMMTDIFQCTKSDGVLTNKQVRYEDNSEYIDISVRRDGQNRNLEDDDVAEVEREAQFEVLSSNHEEDSAALSGRAALWSASRGFMFYSVPHRGSPLADIKTPITRRSVELLEIAKDCPLVLGLQARWLAAQGERGGARGARGGERPARARVRSLVETTRTLMSVLRLRIVSEDSADAGVGSLLGVAVDHREICKPASRRCPLYTELTGLIRAALHCRCAHTQSMDLPPG